MALPKKHFSLWSAAVIAALGIALVSFTYGGSDAAEKALLATVLRCGRLDESASQVRERDFRVFAHQLV